MPRPWLRAVGDERLVRLVRAGQVQAFEAIYDRHHAAILSFCRHMLGGREDGEDATQQVFAAAHRELARSQKPIDLRPWLYAIARNRCLSMLRARHDVVHLDADGAAQPRDLSTEGLDEIVARREDLRNLAADLGSLPDEQRAALVLFELGNLSHAQIADALGCSPPRVKALVFQARTNLMSDRRAREADCGAIREQLATSRGPSLSRAHLRRHLRVCADCEEFAREVKRQRANLALILPVVPTAGLKAATMSSIFASHGASAGGAGVAAWGGTNALVAKVTAGVLLAGAGAGAGLVAVNHDAHHPGRRATASQPGQLSRSVAPSVGASVSGTRLSSPTSDHNRARTPLALPSASAPARAGALASSDLSGNPAAGAAVGPSPAAGVHPGRSKAVHRRGATHRGGTTSPHGSPSHRHTPPQRRSSRAGTRPGLGRPKSSSRRESAKGPASGALPRRPTPLPDPQVTGQIPTPPGLGRGQPKRPTTP